MSLQRTGVQSGPQRALGEFGAWPGETGDPLGNFVAGRQQLLPWHLTGYQADTFGLGSIDIAAGEHDLEGPRRADGPG